MICHRAINFHTALKSTSIHYVTQQHSGENMEELIKCILCDIMRIKLLAIGIIGDIIGYDSHGLMAQINDLPINHCP